jgi:dTDP-4-amino-4,6-dideoxygalactose transaminase
MMEKLSELGVATSMHYKPLHLMSYYKNKYGLKPEDFPESLNKYKSSFSIPIYPDLTDNEISRIISSIRKILDKYGRSG